ncbi:hypothetical protein CsSME_00024519 [Camellia sinensis var. sinensis]
MVVSYSTSPGQARWLKSGPALDCPYSLCLEQNIERKFLAPHTHTHTQPKKKKSLKHDHNTKEHTLFYRTINCISLIIPEYAILSHQKSGTW